VDGGICILVGVALHLKVATQHILNIELNSWQMNAYIPIYFLLLKVQSYILHSKLNYARTK